MTNGASRLITEKVAANTRSAERASIDNGNVEKDSGSKGLEVRSRASAIARLKGSAWGTPLGAVVIIRC